MISRLLRGLRPSDCWELKDKYKSAVVSKELRDLYSVANQVKTSRRGTALARAIFVMEWRGIATGGLLSVVYVIISASIPLTLYLLPSRVMESSSYAMKTIYAQLVAFYLLHLLARGVVALGYFQSSKTEYRVVSALRALIFETAIGVPNQQCEDKKRIAEVTRIYEQETFVIGAAFGHMQTLCGRIALLVLEVYILARMFHSNALVLLAIFAILSLASLLGEFLVRYAREKYHAKSTVRLNLVHECFKGILMAKLNVWERKIRARMERARDEENRPRKIFAFLHPSSLAFDDNTTHLFSTLFLAAVTSEQSLFSVARVLTALILVDRIKNRIHSLIWLGGCLIGGAVSLRSIDQYIGDNQTEVQHAVNIDPKTPLDADVVIAIERACFTDPSSSENSQVLLANVNLTIRRGQLVVTRGKTGTVLVGRVGAHAALHLHDQRQHHGRGNRCHQLALVTLESSESLRILLRRTGEQGAYLPDPSTSKRMAPLTGGQKVGVVGHTGSGKSSLAMALFRLHPLARGRIQFDGVDISRLDLDVLRSSICINPQTPLFYRCTVRHYLYPFDESNDGDLWSAIHKCGLQTSVSNFEAELLDNGENWSLGERQMLCMARAVLEPSRLLILDESFSALDQASEVRLLAVLEDSFAHSTVFLITHRLDQVLKFDKIMVLEKGELMEFGSAAELASDPGSAFY